MSRMTIADLVAKTLAEAGVERLWGVTGDSLNGIGDSLRRLGTIEWMHVRNEEAGAFAASAEAAVTGRLAVCAGSCGPGNLHLINGLFEAQRSQTPVLAIAAHIPSSEIGLGYFQETHPQQLFKECSHYAELVTHPAQIRQVLETAIRVAIQKRGVSVIVLPGDIALLDAPDGADLRLGMPATPVILPAENELARLAKLLNESGAVTLMCGAGCAQAHDQVVALADRLAAPAMHALRGKEYVEWDNPFDVGMTGFVGFSSGYHAMMSCDTLVLLGTDFPYRQFYPRHARVVQIDIRPEVLGRRAPLTMGLIGDVGATIEALLPRLDKGRNRSFLDACKSHYVKARAQLDDLATPEPRDKRIHPQYIARLVSEIASDDAIFAVDVGTPTLWAARYLKMNGKRRLLGSFNHGSMANALPQAMGAQAAFPGRQVVTLSGDGGFSMLMGDILSLRQLKLPVKIVLLNNGSLGFVAMEMKAQGYIDYATDLENPSFAELAKSIGIMGLRVSEPAALGEALRQGFTHDGPTLIEVMTAKQELAMPPTIGLEQVKGFGLFMLKAIVNGRGDEILELAETNLRF